LKINYVPYQELTIHEILSQDNDAFFQDVVRQSIGPQGYMVPSINWIDGIAFITHPMAPTEDVVKENLNGKIHYAAVVFTRTPFKDEVEVKIGGQPFPVRLRKADNNPTFVELVEYLKRFKGSGN